MINLEENISITIIIEQDGEKITYLSPKSSHVEISVEDENGDYFFGNTGLMSRHPDYRFKLNFKPEPFNKDGNVLKAIKDV